MVGWAVGIGFLGLGAAHAANLVQPQTADQVQVTFEGAPTGVSDGSDYVTPYEILLNTGSGQTLQLVTCYDSLDNVNLGDTWEASAFSFSMAAASGYFSGRPNAQAGYEEIAWLSAQTYSNSDQEIALQHVIWNVFGSAPPDQNAAQDTAYAFYANAAAAAASNGYAGFNLNSAVFLEETGMKAGQPGTEQAFVYHSNALINTGASFGSTPEPGSLFLLAGGVLFLLISRGMKRFQSR